MNSLRSINLKYFVSTPFKFGGKPKTTNKQQLTSYTAFVNYFVCWPTNLGAEFLELTILIRKQPNSIPSTREWIVVLIGTIVECPCLIFLCVNRYCLVLPCYWGLGYVSTHAHRIDNSTHSHTHSILLVSTTRISFVSKAQGAAQHAIFSFE